MEICREWPRMYPLFFCVARSHLHLHRLPLRNRHALPWQRCVDRVHSSTSEVRLCKAGRLSRALVHPNFGQTAGMGLCASSPKDDTHKSVESYLEKERINQLTSFKVLLLGTSQFLFHTVAAGPLRCHVMWKLNRKFKQLLIDSL